tara:strand:- start:1991 stop:2485 length:495 start_codon:yes stop_codon:yes gene_type:complete
MALPGHEFLTAHFSDNERTNVEVYWVTPDGLETRVENIEAKAGDPNWEDLLTHISLEKLHEATYKHMQDNDMAFKEDVIKIAKERGLIHDLSNLNDVETMKLIVEFIFGPFDPEKDKEKLFMFKLKLFEVDKIKKSTDREMKAKLRKAENLMDAIKAALKILDE